MTWSLIILLFFTCNKNILRKLGITTKDAIRDKTNNKNQPLFFYCLFYRVVRFEDLALNPFESTLKIFRSLKLPITSNLELYIQKHTKAKNTKNLVSYFQFLYPSFLFIYFYFTAPCNHCKKFKPSCLRMGNKNEAWREKSSWGFL